MVQIKVNEEARHIMNLLRLSGYEAYVVGGAVRDALSGLRPGDWDIFTNATGDQILELFPHGSVLGNDKRQAKILTVMIDDIEVSSYRANGDRTETGRRLYQHQMTCDFSINAIAADKYGHITDNTGGLDDLATKSIRFVGNGLSRIKEDPIRILRAFRFECYGYEMTEDTMQLCYQESGRLLDMPVERIMKEMYKAFEKPSPSKYLQHLHNTGVLYNILPELKGADELMQHPDYHPEGDVLTHIFQTVDNCLPKYRLYALLHDIGKPATAIKNDDGYYSFPSHDSVGAMMIPAIAKRLKLSDKQRQIAIDVCELHMQAYNASKSGRPAAIRKFQAKTDHLEVIRWVCTADCEGRKERIDSAIFRPLPPEVVKNYAVDGKFLMGKGFTQGRELGQAKEKCFEIQLEEGITDPNTIWEMYTELN